MTTGENRSKKHKTSNKQGNLIYEIIIPMKSPTHPFLVSIKDGQGFYLKGINNFYKKKNEEKKVYPLVDQVNIDDLHS